MAAEVKSSPATEPKVSRPEKPNDEAYKAALATAEKEHAAVLERLVCQLLLKEFSLPQAYIRVIVTEFRTFFTGLKD